MEQALAQGSHTDPSPHDAAALLSFVANALQAEAESRLAQVGGASRRKQAHAGARRRKLTLVARRRLSFVQVEKLARDPNDNVASQMLEQWRGLSADGTAVQFKGCATPLSLCPRAYPFPPPHPHFFSQCARRARGWRSRPSQRPTFLKTSAGRTARSGLVSPSKDTVFFFLTLAQGLVHDAT